MTRACVFALVAGLLGSCAAPPADYRAAWAAYDRPPRVALPAQPVRVPLRTGVGGRLYVTAQIDGTERRLLVDTGASTALVLDPHVVAGTAIRTLAAPPRVLSGASGGVDCRVARIPRVVIGGVQLEDCPAIVTDLRTWNQTEPLPIDGILTGRLLALLGAHIDYPTATLTLRPR